MRPIEPGVAGSALEEREHYFRSDRVHPGLGGEGSTAAIDVVRRSVEHATGEDLSRARFHTGTASQRTAAALGARAYTFGTDIHFGAGQYHPGTTHGDRLIAHELVHVAQQRGTATAPRRAPLIGRPGDSHEVEAHAIAQAVTDRSSDPLARPAATHALGSRTPESMIQGDFWSSMGRGWEMYARLNDIGAPFAQELIRWRVLGLGMDFRKHETDSSWNDFMVARPEIQRATALKFQQMVLTFAAGGPTGNEWAGGWKSFSDSMTNVRLNELESMRLTLHGCHRIDIRGRYYVEDSGSDRIVKLGSVRLTWVDRGDLHPGTATELSSGASIDDSEFTGAGWDYDIFITFEMPSLSTWNVSGGVATHTRGWPPETGVPAAGFRG
jgi:hypothetical protein